MNEDRVFIDDERPLPPTYNVLIRTPNEWAKYLEEKGCPRAISCDYYLDYTWTGDDIVSELLYGGCDLSNLRRFRGHSADHSMRRKLNLRVKEHMNEHYPNWKKGC